MQRDRESLKKLVRGTAALAGHQQRKGEKHRTWGDTDRGVATPTLMRHVKKKDADTATVTEGGGPVSSDQ